MHEPAVEEVLKYRNQDAGIAGDPPLCDIIDQAAAVPAFRDKFVPVLQDLLSEAGEALQIPLQANDTYVVVKEGEIEGIEHGYRKIRQAETNVLLVECRENNSGR